jgi:hypothetical protein
MKNSSKFKVGDLVEVRSPEEIFSTLDKNGQLDALPFMPEMLAWTGKRLRVSKRAHKTCDPPNGIDGRSMPSAVHLEDTRCDGSAHAGCQARCLLFWKDAWLKRVEEEPAGRKGAVHSDIATAVINNSGCTEEDVLAATRKRDADDTPENPTYVCQSTQVEKATQFLPWWDLRQYVEDYSSGNVGLSDILGSFFYFAYDRLISSGLGMGAALRWLYDSFQKLTGGTVYPARTGRIPQGQKTPNTKLGLQPGELVRIRSYDEILNTLDETNHNRGMWFDAEMVPHCGKTFKVLDRVNTIINEKTGKVLHIKNDCIVLDKAVCLACYAKNRLFCPRGIFAYWREIWLERLSPTVDTKQKPQEAAKEAVPTKG